MVSMEIVVDREKWRKRSTAETTNKEKAYKYRHITNNIRTRLSSQSAYLKL